MSEEKKTDAEFPVIQVGHLDDPTAIPVTISLPAAVWERLTADLRDDDRVSLGRPELPDLSLEARIRQFVDRELLSWEASVTNYPIYGPNDDHDLDDGMPF